MYCVGQYRSSIFITILHKISAHAISAHVKDSMY